MEIGDQVVLYDEECLSQRFDHRKSRRLGGGGSRIEETGQYSLIVLNSIQRDITIACGSVSGRDRDR